MLDGKLSYFINRFAAPKASVLVMSFQEMKKYHLSQPIGGGAVRHT
jgi:hypothetical protein